MRARGVAKNGQKTISNDFPDPWAPKKLHEKCYENSLKSMKLLWKLLVFNKNLQIQLCSKLYSYFERIWKCFFLLYYISTTRNLKMFVETFEIWKFFPTRARLSSVLNICIVSSHPIFAYILLKFLKTARFKHNNCNGGGRGDQNSELVGVTVL